MADEQLQWGSERRFTPGSEIGRIRGLEGLSVEHVGSGHEFGEAEVTRRRWECGELGRLDHDVPEARPNCGADREESHYWTEE